MIRANGMFVKWGDGSGTELDGRAIGERCLIGQWEQLHLFLACGHLISHPG